MGYSPWGRKESNMTERLNQTDTGKWSRSLLPGGLIFFFFFA